MRKDDQQESTSRFRIHRVHFSGGHWWVSTREGERGPFPTRHLADLDAHNYGRRSSADPEGTMTSGDPEHPEPLFRGELDA